MIEAPELPPIPTDFFLETETRNISQNIYFRRCKATNTYEAVGLAQINLNAVEAYNYLIPFNLDDKRGLEFYRANFKPFMRKCLQESFNQTDSPL